TSPVSGVHAAIQKTRLDEYLVHFGIFLAPITAWLLFRNVRVLRRSPLTRLAGPGRRTLGVDDQLWLSLAGTGLTLALSLALVLAVRDKVTVAATFLALALLAFLAAIDLRRRPADAGPRLFVLALLGLGFGLSLGVDLVTLNGDITRMNT